MTPNDRPAWIEASPAPEQAAGTYLRATARHWRLVVATTVLALLVAVVTLAQSASSYEASSSVLVSPLSASDPTFTGLGVVLDTGDPTRTVQTAAALMDSREGAARAAAAMGSGWNAARVQASVSITPRGQSNVLAVTARGDTAAQAARLADVFARAALAYRAALVQHNVSAQITALRSQLSRQSRAGQQTAEVQNLITRLGELQTIQATGRDPTLTISETAQLPGSPTGAPSWLVVMLALVAGVAVGTLGAQALELFSRRVRDEREAVRLLPFPVLAAIPRVPRSPNGAGLSPRLLTPVAFEQVRLLRDQIRRLSKTSVIMVTSADAGDGKTTVAAALAAAFAEGDQEVILMDLDLRNPGVGRLFRTGTGPLAEAEGGPPRQLSETLVSPPGFPRLKLVPTRHGDMAAFESLIGRLPKLMTEARKIADWVIVDTAPLGTVSDAVRIADVCDGVVFVVRPGHTERSKLIAARDLLERVHAPMVGMVLIGEGVPSAGSYYGYGYAAGQTEDPAASWLG
jgi:Mrp family chromosome partitioning ATPase/capsular polysaccharide biosynthesis protein